MYNNQKQVSKVIIYYTDGSYEELSKNTLWGNPVQSPNPFTMKPNTCMVCGGIHEGNMPCPSYKVTAEAIGKWQEQWKDWKENVYTPGQEDPGK